MSEDGRIICESKTIRLFFILIPPLSFSLSPPRQPKSQLTHPFVPPSLVFAFSSPPCLSLSLSLSLSFLNHPSMTASRVKRERERERERERRKGGSENGKVSQDCEERERERERKE